MPFAAIVLAMLPAVLDQTILATALPTVATDQGRLSDVSWVVTAYVVAAAVATPLWGKLGDRHGRKLLLESSLALFLGASALCGLAQDLTFLVVAAPCRARTGRYKRFPVAGLGLMTVALGGLAAFAGDPSRASVAIGLGVFGLGFGMVGQVLIVVVQNGVERRDLGIGMATTSFFRALGGAIGAAVLGAVFAARTGAAGTSGRSRWGRRVERR